MLGGTLAVVATLSFPLFRHLLATPANAPDHLQHRSAQEDSIMRRSTGTLDAMGQQIR